MDTIMKNITVARNLITDHPYYPLEVEIASYLANEWSMAYLLTVFFGLCAAILLITLTVVKRVHPNLHSADKAAIWWFILCKIPPK